MSRASSSQVRAAAGCLGTAAAAANLLPPPASCRLPLPRLSLPVPVACQPERTV